MRALAILVVAASLLASCKQKAAPPAPARTPEPPRRSVVDAHAHIAPAAYARAVGLMESAGVAVMVNLSGRDPGGGLEESLAAARRFPGRFAVLMTPDLGRAGQPDFGAYAASALELAVRLGARGVKIPKALGLGLRDDRTGKLLPVDDARFDPLWSRAGELGVPVAIHTADPRAFFEPATPRNERYEELALNPEWSFHGKLPWTWAELLEQQLRVVARHPRTTFISVHFGGAAEEPDRVAAALERYPNLYLDLAARFGEFGRHPAEQMRAFLVRFADRILFGTDIGIGGPGRRSLMLGAPAPLPHTDADVTVFYGQQYAYLETQAKHLPNPVPIQGRWPIDGVGLPAEVLKRIYFENAKRLFRLDGQSP
jgi:predicted TIM-barrel fold metal-dependent hydrolase